MGFDPALRQIDVAADFPFPIMTSPLSGPGDSRSMSEAEAEPDNSQFAGLLRRVSDGTRTYDHLDHNPAVASLDACVAPMK